MLMRLLPAIVAEEVFALKGGSAINLFYRDMPRLSVDIEKIETSPVMRATVLPPVPTREEIALSDLEAARTRLITGVRRCLTDNTAAFLMSLHDAEPDFALIDLPQAERLPAVQWKLLNLRRLKAENPAKHAEQGEMLKALFA